MKRTLTDRERANDALWVERERLEKRLHDSTLPSDVRAATATRITQIIRALARDGVHLEVPADDAVKASVGRSEGRRRSHHTDAVSNSKGAK